MTNIARHHTALPCGWCGTTNNNNQTNCVNCGGPLPPSAALTIDDPGPPPPAQPRRLPSKYKRQIMLWKNPLVFIGALFTVVFCWTIIFPLIGLPLWIVGHRRARARLLALEHGIPAKAELVEVFRDTSVAVNNRHPWKLIYLFQDKNGHTHEGWAHAWQAIHSRREAGEAFWVVYVANDPSQNAVWPPLR